MLKFFFLLIAGLVTWLPASAHDPQSVWSTYGVHFGSESNNLSFGSINPLRLTSADTQLSTTGVAHGNLKKPGGPNVLVFHFQPLSAPSQNGLTLTAKYPTRAVLYWYESLNLFGLCGVCETGPKSTRFPVTYNLSGVSNTTTPTPGPLVFPMSVQVTVSGCYDDYFSWGLQLSLWDFLSSNRCWVLSQQVITTMVAVNITANCYTESAVLAFGAVSPNAPTQAATTASVTCTNKTPYALTLSSGYSGNTSARAMKHKTASAVIPYQIFTDAGRTRPVTGSTKFTGTGSGVRQSVAVYGTAYGSFNTVPGSYADLLTMSLEY